MKSNEHQSPVDEYFRQHEADIPVQYDPNDWAQLAAALDAAQGKTPPPPQPPRARRFRGVKGWWMTGLWLLLLLPTAWVVWEQVVLRPAPGNVDDLEIAPMPSPESGTLSNDRRLGNPADPVSAGKSTEDAAGSGRKSLAPPLVSDWPLAQPAAGPESSVSEIPKPPVDSIRVLAAPLDSANTEKAPPAKKKKKHLFW